jgi:hypothetical protein
MELKEGSMKYFSTRLFKISLIITIVGSSGLLNIAWGQSIDLSWNTFMGSAGNDACRDIAADGSGNIYVIGESADTWGTPINAYSGMNDVFIVKLSPTGARLWHTFLGSSHHDYGNGVVVDGSGNLYVTGYSYNSWGTPLNAHAGGYDAFVAKLDTNGALQWHTFMGSGSHEYGNAVTVDGIGNVYVAGSAEASWGVPVNAHAGSIDAFVAKLNSSGIGQWHTFMGSTAFDQTFGIAVDGSENVYVAGYCNAAWGTPINAYMGGNEAFAAKLNSSGIRLWNTFMGSVNSDFGHDIALDVSNAIYVVGGSSATWGTPVKYFSGDTDAFVAKLNSSGMRLWNTFMGSGSLDTGFGIAVDESSNTYIGGKSHATWGSPGNPYSGMADVFAAKLNSSGVRLWNTFIGSGDTDWGQGIAIDTDRNVFVGGYSYATWGSPINGHAGGNEAFAAKLYALDPEPDIKANGSDATITINQGDPLFVTVELFARDMAGNNVDWWLVMRTSNPPPNRWNYFDFPTKTWQPGVFPTHQGKIRNIYPPKTPPGTSGLSAGTYTFYFGVDAVMNGVVDFSVGFYDKVKVIINP